MQAESIAERPLGLHSRFELSNNLLPIGGAAPLGSLDHDDFPISE